MSVFPKRWDQEPSIEKGACDQLTVIPFPGRRGLVSCCHLYGSGASSPGPVNL